MYRFHISSLQCGSICTFCIDNENNIWCLDLSYNGCLGIYSRLHSPKKMDNLFDIKQISCGDKHCAFLNYNGNVWTIGSNTYSQLGIEKESKEICTSNIPEKINIPPIKQLSCGIFYTICLSYDNELWSFGNNGQKQLGLGDYTKLNVSKPTKIENFNNIEYISCGGFFSVCIDFENNVYSWGSNNANQLGIGESSTLKKVSTPIKCDHFPNDIISLFCGSTHTILLTEQGKVYTFGDNNRGQLGMKDNPSKLPTQVPNLPEIIRIECGEWHSMCIDIDYNLWVFGYNSNGQLGLDIKESHQFYPIKVSSLSNIIDISHGGLQTYVKTDKNDIYAFGKLVANNTSTNSLYKDSQRKPVKILENKKDIWYTNIGKSRQKSARK